MKFVLGVMGLGLVGFGCGEVVKASGDAGIDAPVSPMPDAVVVTDAPPPACDVTKPFGTPVLLEGVNTAASEISAWRSADGLALYLSASTTVDGSGSPGNFDLFEVRRTTPTGTFGAPVALAGLNSNVNDLRPVVTEDGLSLIAMIAFNGFDFQLGEATRASTADAFGRFVELASASSTVEDGGVWVSADGLTVYFVSLRDGGSNRNIYRATRASRTTAFTAAVPVPELNTPASEDAPVLSADGLEILFARQLSGSSADIYRATRTSATGTFGAAALVTELSDSMASDRPNWLSPDRCELVFISTRAGGKGSDDIWIATRPQ